MRQGKIKKEFHIELQSRFKNFFYLLYLKKKKEKNFKYIVFYLQRDKEYFFKKFHFNRLYELLQVRKKTDQKISRINEHQNISLSTIFLQMYVCIHTCMYTLCILENFISV